MTRRATIAATLLRRAAAAFALSWPLLGIATVVVLVVLGRAQSDLLDHQEDFSDPAEVVLSEANSPQSGIESQAYRDLRGRFRTGTIVYAGLALLLSLSVATFMFPPGRGHAERAPERCLQFACASDVSAGSPRRLLRVEHRVEEAIDCVDA